MTKLEAPLAFTVIADEDKTIYASCGRREDDELVRIVQVQFKRPEPARPVPIGRWDRRVE